MFTILVGRFVSPTHPLVLTVAGVLDLPVAKLIMPSIIGCLLRPPFCFLPGILADAVINIPAGVQSDGFKWLLLATAVFLWVGGWPCWRLWRSGKATDHLSHYLSRGRLLWLTPLISTIDAVTLMVLIRHLLMPVYVDILRKVVGVQEIVLCGLLDATFVASYRTYKTHYPQVG